MSSIKIRCKRCPYKAYSKGMCHAEDYIVFVNPEDNCRLEEDKKETEEPSSQKK